MNTHVDAGSFRRPADGFEWTPTEPILGLSEVGGAGWQSNGGPTRRHPARALPFTLEVQPPATVGRLERIYLVGVFALHATPASEPSGAIGGTVQVLHGDRILVRRDLIQGRHYTDCTDTTPIFRLNGDGTTVETVGSVDIDGQKCRVDQITIDVPGGVNADRLLIKDLGTPASFVVFDVLFEFEDVAVCPFKGHGGQVALSEIGTILRLRDRARFDQALHQLSDGIRSCEEDLDEARGLGLTFLAAVVGAMLEMDAPRSAHKAQLEAARRMELLTDADEIAHTTVTMAQDLTAGVVRRGGQTGDVLIDKALQIVARNFARDLDDAQVAHDLSLSTSHFRHLFREATKQPFHKYVVSMRLEKAREMLLQTDTPVSQVASSVGFQSSAHFSRAFSKRFGMAPSALRLARR